MIGPTNLYKRYLESDSIRLAQDRDNAMDRDDAEEKRESGDWLERLIERKLRSES